MVALMSYYFSLCIILRLFLAFLVKQNYKNNLRYLFICFYLLAGSGLLYNFIKNSPKNGAFGQKVWWQKYRLIHFIIFFCVSILLFYKYKYTWIILILDTLIGVFGHIHYHYL